MGNIMNYYYFIQLVRRFDRFRGRIKHSFFGYLLQRFFSQAFAEIRLLSLKLSEFIPIVYLSSVTTILP